MKGKMKVIPPLEYGDVALWCAWQACSPGFNHSKNKNHTTQSSAQSCYTRYSLLQDHTLGKKWGAQNQPQKQAYLLQKTDAEDANRLYDEVQFLRPASNNLLALSYKINIQPTCTQSELNNSFNELHTSYSKGLMIRTCINIVQNSLLIF